jgi:hypothetical protein
MCMACSPPVAGGHWTEVGSPPSGSRPDGRDRMLARLLSADGLSVRPWGAGFVLTMPSGRMALARTVDEIWGASQALTGRSLDPLGPPFLPGPSSSR